MRVHSIEAIAIDIPLAKNFGGSTYAVRKRSTVITRLRTEDGSATTATAARRFSG
jgi:D-galactarolactone cycloisomerase